MRRLTGERGFTIVEMMVAVVVLLVGALGTLAMLDGANRRGRAAQDRQNATALARQMLDTANKRSRGAADRQNGTAVARQIVEAAKSVPYRDVAPGSIVSTLREDDALTGISGSPWRIERDNTVFTIQVEVCWLDEPADGLGSRAPGNFCAGSGNGGTADGNSIDHKRVTVTTSWNNSSGAGSSRQSTLIAARGGIDAPGVTAVELTSPAISPITDPMIASASFSVTTNQDAAAVVWSLDGAQQDTATGANQSWTFTWQLPSADGIYDISAQAFDGEGLGGEVRSATVVVNRFAPTAPRNMLAVRKGDVVETIWSGNAERDVIGYRVYRQAAGGPVEMVCDFTTELTCIDSNPPARSTEVVDYWVVALDRDAQDQQREGAPSTRVDVNAPNSPPNPPVNLILSKDVDGNNVLQWSASALPDPDGDPIDSYVIYRDGTAIKDRISEVVGTETTFVDYTTNGSSVHEYWVTAADERFAESIPLGPVTG
jgi:prepilin-type N-terminal cleavage/methylation domain-containing protein